MLTRWFVIVATLAACGGGAKHGPTTASPALQPQIGELQWYRAVSACAQGPFEMEVATTGNKWGEEIELRIATPRKIALHAVMIVDGEERASHDGVIDREGKTSGKPDNAKCVADARERLVLGRTGGGGGTPGQPGVPIVPGRRVDVPTPDTNVPLEIAEPPDYFVPSVIHVRFDTPQPGARVKIRFWSVEPNDLTGVLFGAVRVAWRPNIAEADYEAYLVQINAEAEAKRRRAEDEERLRAERRERQLEEARRNYRPPPINPEAQRRAREAAERERLRAAEEERRRWEADRLRAAEDERERVAEERRRAIEAALEAERARKRAEWCAAHPESRDCWGAGGMRVHLELEERGNERIRYCAANREDARCWTEGERSKRRAVWATRISQANVAPKPPEGPPPSPLADPQPPKLSDNATWRPGYWHWLDGNWIWLAGQWRVPERDIEEDKTARAPTAPPPPQVEVIAVAPARTAVWVTGFWQWNGSQWIWFPGSWQLRPSASVQWRAPEWRARGSVHVLVPGGWIRVRGVR